MLSLRRFGAICLLFLLSTAAAKCPIGAIQGLSPRSCYEVYSELLSWEEADGRCEADGGHLTPITGGLTNSFLTTLGSRLGCATTYWVGGVYDAEVAGQWSWTDGTKWSYTNWAKGQPIRGPVCLSLNITTGQWYSASCVQMRSYICQVPEVGSPADGQTPPPNLPTPPPPDRCPTGWDYIPTTNLCYQGTVSTSYSWNDARTLCQNAGGDLVSIPSRSVNAEVLMYLLNSQPSQSYVAVGLSYNSTASKWSWDDGSAASYTNWYTGYPISPDSYGCAFMKLQAPAIGQWLNFACVAGEFAVLCERESFEF